MRFFKSLLATYGFGAAKIDLFLANEYLMMGQQAKGEIVLTVGKMEQKIIGLHVNFKLRSRFLQRGRTVFQDKIERVNEVISHIPIRQKEFSVSPGQVVRFPFSFHCPDLLPVSSVRTEYVLETKLEIDSEIYAFDRDFVKVMPTGLIKNFMEGFARLGFIHFQEGYTGKKDDQQMVLFQPTTWLRGEFSEIVFSYSPGASKNSITGFFELDKSILNADKRIFGKLADHRNEKKGYYSFSAAELATPEKAAETIRNFIIQNS